MRRATRPSAPQVIRLLDAVVFNALIGNHDAHAKNFSLIYTEKTPMLAPLYDLLCTAVYPTLTAKMAIKLGSKYRFSEVHERHWEQFAGAAGLSWAQTRKRVLRIAAQLSSVARRLQAEAIYRDEALIGDIANLIEQRCDLTARRFNSGQTAVLLQRGDHISDSSCVEFGGVELVPELDKSSTASLR